MYSSLETKHALLSTSEGTTELKSIFVSQKKAGLQWSSLLTEPPSKITCAILLSNAEILKLVSISWRQEDSNDGWHEELLGANQLKAIEEDEPGEEEGLGMIYLDAGIAGLPGSNAKIHYDVYSKGSGMISQYSKS